MVSDIGRLNLATTHEANLPQSYFRLMLEHERFHMMEASTEKPSERPRPVKLIRVGKVL